MNKSEIKPISRIERYRRGFLRIWRAVVRPMTRFWLMLEGILAFFLLWTVIGIPVVLLLGPWTLFIGVFFYLWSIHYSFQHHYIRLDADLKVKNPRGYA